MDHGQATMLEKNRPGLAGSRHAVYTWGSAETTLKTTPDAESSEEGIASGLSGGVLHPPHFMMGYPHFIRRRKSACCGHRRLSHGVPSGRRQLSDWPEDDPGGP